MFSALAFPYLSNTLFKTGEKQKLTSLISAAAELRRQSVNYIAIGEMDISQNDIVFYLDRREIKRFTLPYPPESDGPIFFNRFGVCSGGVLKVRFSRLHLLRFAPVSGHISLETP